MTLFFIKMNKLYWFFSGVGITLFILFLFYVSFVLSSPFGDKELPAINTDVFTTEEKCVENDLFWNDVDMACVSEIRLEAELIKDGDAVVDHLRDHLVYKKFKLIYPDSTEVVLLRDIPSLFVDQSDSYGNVLQLHISKSHDMSHYEYLIYCYAKGSHTPQWVLDGTDLDFLSKTDCLLD